MFKKLGSNEKGLGMIEMALVTPVLLIMALGLYDCSVLLHNYFIAHKAAQKTLRYAVAIPGLEENTASPHHNWASFPPSKHGAVIDRAEFLLQGYGLMRANPDTAYSFDGTNWAGGLVKPRVQSTYDDDPNTNMVSINITVPTETYLTGWVTGTNTVAVNVVGPYLFAPSP